jgi:hypothetical protein
MNSPTTPENKIPPTVGINATSANAVAVNLARLEGLTAPGMDYETAVDQLVWKIRNFRENDVAELWANAACRLDKKEPDALTIGEYLDTMIGAPKARLDRLWAGLILALATQEE